MHSNRLAAAPLLTLRRCATGLLCVLATLAPELQAATVVKQLYMGAGTALSRTQSLSTTATTITEGGGSATWTLTPALAGPLLIANTTIDIYLQATCTSGNKTRTFDLSLDYNDGGATNIGTLTGQSFTFTGCGTYQTIGPYSITPGAAINLNAGATLSLTVTNTSTGGGTRDLGVRPSDGTTSLSRVEYDVDTTTIINVDSVLVYTTAYPSVVADTGIDAGSTGYIRAVVSDPFGEADIEPTTNQAVLTITGPAAAPGPVNMTNVGADGSTLTKTFEYAWAVPGGQTPGIYTATVVADEGVEATVNHSLANATIGVGSASLTLTRLSTAFSDPVNNTTNPKRVPGSIVTHTVSGQNDGNGKADTVVVYEQLSASSEYDVAYGVVFNAGTSGLTAPTVTYSTNTCATFANNLTPTGPYDATVRCIRIAMGGGIPRNIGTPPAFTLSYRARVP